MEPAVMATDGKIISWMLVIGAWVNGVYPVAGNHPRPTAKTATRIGATTNGGRAKSPKVEVVEMLSSVRFGLRDTTRASGMATAKARTWLMMISSMVTGEPVARMWVTDSWLR